MKSNTASFVNFEAMLLVAEISILFVQDCDGLCK
jgi:hypothetical protein